MTKRRDLQVRWTIDLGTASGEFRIPPAASIYLAERDPGGDVVLTPYLADGGEPFSPWLQGPWEAIPVTGAIRS